MWVLQYNQGWPGLPILLTQPSKYQALRLPSWVNAPSQTPVLFFLFDISVLLWEAGHFDI